MWLFIYHVIFIMTIIIITMLVKDYTLLAVYISSMSFMWLGTLICIVFDEIEEIKKEIKRIRS
ncbi:MAG: hypothetical protein JHC33_08070 [Ignisphaera sp.]|nr:hypothetical protein [Ignisphaera sp.]